MAAESKDAPAADEKTKVFISYSRKDMAFADQLEAALKPRGFQVSIDREEIYAFEDWWNRIQALIGSADTIIFVLSPDAVRPDGVALQEIDYAASLNKRFAPIVCRRVNDADVPKPLRKLNFIFFDEPARFAESLDRLVEALQTDVGWIRQHTEYGEAQRRWAAAGRPGGLLLQSPTLEVAEHWIVSRPPRAPEPTLDILNYIAASRKNARSSQRLRRLVQVSMFTLLVGIILVLVGWINQDYLKDQWRWYTVTRPYMVSKIRPYVLSVEKERSLKPGDSFKECASNCPEMIVVPAKSFIMGSSKSEPGHEAREEPQHEVGVPQPLAISKNEMTFAEWDDCANYGDCEPDKDDGGFGRGDQPLINVSWVDAQRYAAWLSKMTGKTYRLLSEAEYEYAARGGSQTAYPWGDTIGKNNADCTTCGSRWDNKQPAPVGSFAANGFGLYDMVGNVWEWVQDCVHNDYSGGPPTDGSAWIKGGDCSERVVRGGSWSDPPKFLRSAERQWDPINDRYYRLSFRLARTLDLQ
jgi:formylglycine-generating enzyme required for sulfatase activity